MPFNNKSCPFFTTTGEPISLPILIIRNALSLNGEAITDCVSNKVKIKNLITLGIVNGFYHRQQKCNLG
jgi:hypothetical protein